MWRILTMISRLDHPRSRGVYNISTQIAETGIGSSPLARGLRLDPGANLGGGGIIPARAGSTIPLTRRGRTYQDHPRSRGVYVRSDGRVWGEYGSSPLARGLRSPSGGWGGRGGIIPARAGSTQGGEDVPGVGEDHPRSRGVYSMWQTLTTISHGSSPLARGLQVLYVPVHDV